MLTTKENINFKQVAKNIKKELSHLKFDLSYGVSLNLLARSLGYSDYNTYTALCNIKENQIESNIKKESIKDYLKNETKNILDFRNKEQISDYSKDIANLVHLTEFNQYDVFIDNEISANHNKYYLLFRLKDNISHTYRVFYSPEYQYFSLFIYPNLKDTMQDYYFDIGEIENNNLKFYLKDTIKHLHRKRWYTKEIHNDLINLIEAIYQDRYKFSGILKKYSDQYLEQVYKDKNRMDYN